MGNGLVVRRIEAQKEMLVMSYFKSTYSEVCYPIADENEKGLRNAQVGAIHAIASHATVAPNDAAIIVMPTGSGKTAVLMLAPYILRKDKVLIVTPSAMVRGQISKDYSQLKTLKDIGVLARDTTPPIVLEAVHMYSDSDVERIQSADVVIATAQVAASISDSPASSMFDYIVIDEAHHVPAPTWQHILTSIPQAASLLVTATPFRLDKKVIRGTHVFNYPLSKAYKDGIFGSILFDPIEEAKDKDRLIALEAERVFQNDRNENYEHFLMVRTDTREKARDLEALYRESTSLRLKRIDSSMSYSILEHTIEQLKKKELDGIICVDMLGEGFDFPNLKIAAVHDPQKSLASTLQFIGRFARTNADNIGTAKFIAMNDESLKIGNQKLYASDAIWQDMIINISETSVSHELEVVESLSHFSRPETGESEISLHNIRPNCHAKVYRVPDFNIEGELPDAIASSDQVFRSIETQTVVCIIPYNLAPLWLAGGQTPDVEVSLFIVHYQAETGLLFIYSQHKTETTYERIARAFSSSYFKIPRDKIHRVLAGYKNYEFFNTGMQNRHAEKGESYRILSGSNTAQSIDETSGQMHSAGHAFVKALDNGNEITIGYSSGSKCWSSQYLSIPEYVKWCDHFGKKIVDDTLHVVTNTNYDRLPVPEEIQKYEGSILFCLLTEKTYLSPPHISVQGSDIQPGLLTDADIIIDGISSGGRSILFHVTFSGVTEHFTCDTLGHYSSTTRRILCRDGRRLVALSEYFNDCPLQFRTARDTVYWGAEVACGSIELEKYNQEHICAFDWESMNTDVGNECNSSVNGKRSIQDTLSLSLQSSSSFSHIIIDHGQGEIADFITFSSEGSFIRVSLYHCKAKKGVGFNSYLNDIYEVAQQAVKSTIWVKSKSCLLEKIRKRIRGAHNTKFIKGDIRSLQVLLRSEKALLANIYIVQPSISHSIKMDDAFGEVLSAATMYIRHTGRADELLVIGSK